MTEHKKIRQLTNFALAAAYMRDGKSFNLKIPGGFISFIANQDKLKQGILTKLVDKKLFVADSKGGWIPVDGI